MDIAAVYHRPDSEMAYLGANGVFEIRLKVKHDDVFKVELLYGDPYGTKVNEKDAGAWDYLCTDYNMPLSSLTKRATSGFMMTANLSQRLRKIF